MRYKATFLTGFATGYVLGARAGRERYESIAKAFRNIKDNPSVQETAGVLQAQVSDLASTAKSFVGEKVSSKIGGEDVTDTVSPYPDVVPAAATVPSNGHDGGVQH